MNINKLSNIKKNGYALPYVIFICLIITSLLISIILIISFYNIQSIKIIEKKKLDLACYSASQLILSDTSLTVNNKDELLIDSLKVKIKIDTIGLYERITTTAIGYHDSSKIIYWISSVPPLIFENAIITPKPNFQATVIGNTKIIGNWLCTTNKIEKGNMFGKERVKDDYLEGKLVINRRMNPKLFNEKYLKRLKERLSDKISRVNPKEMEGLMIDSNYSNKKSLTDLMVSGNLVFKDKIAGNRQEDFEYFVKGDVTFFDSTQVNQSIMIFSKGPVQIKEGCRIQNLFIYSSDSVFIEKDCQFYNCQLFSEKKIEVENSRFDYPNIICLYNDASDTTKLKSIISLEKTVFNGTIMLVSSVVGLSNNFSKICIDKESKFQGLVYSENNVEIYGEIYGSIFTYNFWYHEEPNTIYN
jgi:hypothetical protein